MWRIIIICILLGTNILPVFSQGRHYLVEKSHKFEKLCFTLTANSGACFIKGTKSAHPINIFGKPGSDGITPQFITKLVNGVQHVEFKLQENNPEGFGGKLSASVFSSLELDEENEWHVYLTRTKPLLLNLNYGVGDANVDLSGLAVKKITINTGSADVNVGYSTKNANTIAMDTFYVRVDMGNLSINQANLARAKEIIADVGFGNLKMDFSNKLFLKSHVSASVGAGTLEVMLSGFNSPVLIQINNSPLCSVSLPDNFRKIGVSTYANEFYSGNNASSKLLSFDLDVTMGKISFLAD